MEKKKQNVLLIIMGVLILAELVSRICILNTFTLSGILIVMSLIFTTLYGFILYKKPHGNMLKYAFLLFALANIVSSSTLIKQMGNPTEVIRIIASAIVCYCAGRLNRVDQNKYILPIIGVFFFGLSVYWTIAFPAIGFLQYFSFFNFTITFTTLMIAYFVRYKEHKEAGLTDK